MTRQYKTSAMTYRPSKRFHVDLPYPTEPEHNSQYWQDKLSAAMDEIIKNDDLVAIWDSPIVPQNATYKEHAEIALGLLREDAEQLRILDAITTEAQDIYFSGDTVSPVEVAPWDEIPDVIDPYLQKLNNAVGYDIVTALCSKTAERVAWEKEYLAKRAAHAAKYFQEVKR